MAQSTKKPTFLAPGRLGLNRGQGMKSTLIPRISAKAPLSKDNQILNIPLSSNTNRHTTNEGRVSMEKERYSSHPSFLQYLNEGVHDDNSLHRSNTTAANNENLDQSASQDASRNQEEDYEEESIPQQRKRKRGANAKPRGVNKCKKVANLKEGEKLAVDIYDNGPVGENHKDMTRHMGKLIRDRTICPVRVHSWGEIDNNVKEHMWQSVLNKFAGKGGIELDRRTTIDHLKRLWHNWRGILMQNSIIKKGGLEKALDDTPNDLTPEDWEWLVKEHFSSEKFQKVSATNSSNRGNLTMLPRTGSMPFRQVIWEDMGGKEGAPRPPLSAVFKRTRKKKKVGI